MILTWRDNAHNETHLRIERAVRSQGQFSYRVVAEVDAAQGAEPPSYTDVVATNGTYRYRVSAFNRDTGVVSGYSNEVQLRVN